MEITVMTKPVLAVAVAQTRVFRRLNTMAPGSCAWLLFEGSGTEVYPSYYFVFHLSVDEDGTGHISGVIIKGTADEARAHLAAQQAAMTAESGPPDFIIHNGLVEPYQGGPQPMTFQKPQSVTMTSHHGTLPN
jgi:hypothetical protein